MNTLKDFYFVDNSNELIKNFINENKDLLKNKSYFKRMIYENLKNLVFNIFIFNTDKQDKIFDFVYVLFSELKKNKVFKNYYTLTQKTKFDNYSEHMYFYILSVFEEITDTYKILINEHKKEALKILDSYIGEHLRKLTNMNFKELKEMHDKIDSLIMKDDIYEQYF